MGSPTIRMPANDSSGTTNPFDETIEEIRAICRLHACPTGQWEDLVDLPLRISQDAGLRFDFIAIVHTLQSSRFNLPDVLDLLVLAIGGASAARHSHQLAEQLNHLGGFLSGIGHWPNTDFKPVLAPGEVPVDLAKFARPQAIPTSSVDPTSATPPSPPLPPKESVDLRSTLEAPPELNEPGAPSSPSVASTERVGLSSTPQAPPDLPLPLNHEPGYGPASSVPDAKSIDVTAIAEALARLERGNLELRAHLDSIDQRISRMEPRLDLNSPPPALSAEINTSPILLHRGTQNSVQASSLAAEPVVSPTLTLEPFRDETPHTRSVPVTEHHNLTQPERENKKLQPDVWPRQEANEVPSGAREPRTPAWAVASETHTEPPSSRPPFSRFSRDAISPDPIVSDVIAVPVLEPVPQPGPEPAPPASLEVKPSGQLGPELKPGALPRGFFGTVPETDSAAPAAEITAGSKRGRLGLLFTAILLLTLLGAAALIYRHSVATDTDSAINSGENAPIAAPRASSGNLSTRGPLTATPTSPVPSMPPLTSGKGAPGSFSASRLSPSTPREPHSGGFRPAGTFVPAAVMDGRLLSAPVPEHTRLPASAGNRGLVTMEINISSTGQVEDAHVLGGNSALRTNAVEAIRNWRYRPYQLNGSPVEVRTIVRVDLSHHQSQPADRGAPFPP